jgi:hypothetical protein
MDKYRRMTYARLTEILRRQDPPKFGSAYEPAIRATREEAPSNCRPAFVWSSLLRREVSTLSTPEREVLSIALYCAWLIDLQEQRMLPFGPSPHPLSGHPLAAGQMLPEFKGTLEVANRLNYLRYHPTIHRPKQDSAEGGEVPGCFIGDFLLFLRDRNGPFCVNLNVKSTRAEFTAPQVGVTVKTDMARASAAERARHEIERNLYQDVGIRTVEIASDELPKILVANLLQLSLWQKRRHTLTQEEVETVIEAFNHGLDSGASALDVITATELSHRIGPYEQKIVLYQGIFSRRIRPDLFDCHFFIDRPMRPESKDALEVFAAWFRRST